MGEKGAFIPLPVGSEARPVTFQKRRLPTTTSVSNENAMQRRLFSVTTRFWSPLVGLFSFRALRRSGTNASKWAIRFCSNGPDGEAGLRTLAAAVRSRRLGPPFGMTAV